MKRICVLSLIMLIPLIAPVSASDQGWLLEDFDTAYQSDRWSFSDGAEFPGAQGRFSRTADAAHGGHFGGKLTFDFSRGGNYVASVIRLPETDPVRSDDGNALRLWLKRPDGTDLALRCTDSTGQTFQKTVDCAADGWIRLTIPFRDWTEHWGGPNDGKWLGQPQSLALVVQNTSRPTGAVLFDDLRLVNHRVALASVSFPAYRFSPEEGWRTRSDGKPGETRLERRTWSLDFSQGARVLTLAVPDRVLLSSVNKFQLRVRGSTRGHPVRLLLKTHFMTFHKVIGEFSGDGEQQLVTDGPPGPGWEWSGGENDGKIHGPLRLVEIQLAANGHTDKCVLELRDVVIDAACSDEKRAVLVAESKTDNADSHFLARMRAVSNTPLTGKLGWVLRDWDGHELGRGQHPVTIPAEAVPAEFRLPLTNAVTSGRKFLEAEFTLDVAGQDVPPVQTAWVAPLENTGDATLNPESPFGMGLYLNRYSGDAEGRALMERAALAARDAGVKWSREEFAWARIEPQRGEVDWSYYDNLLACARRNGITVYAIVGFWTPWTKP
jgi:hypothetical protein